MDLFRKLETNQKTRCVFVDELAVGLDALHNESTTGIGKYLTKSIFIDINYLGHQ